jgi:hypothetical protein
VLKEYYVLIIRGWVLYDVYRDEETDAMAFENYPSEETIKQALEVYSNSKYARVEKRYKLA